MASQAQTPAAHGDPAAGQRQNAADSQGRGDSGEMSAGERRLLAAMPLHAITALHGESGLRERFAIEIAEFSDGDRIRCQRALELAAQLHASDRRQREPYVNHLLRAAIRIITYYGVRDPDVICAALLHDAVEDHARELTAGEGQQAALAALAEQFGDRVAEFVAAVTNPPHEPGRDRHEQYREHVAASLQACPWARVIKVSDFTDNGVGLIHTTGPRLDRLADKYAPLVPVLAELIARADTPLSDDAKERILGQLDRARQRFAAIRRPADPTRASG
jgi:HD domain